MYACYKCLVPSNHQAEIAAVLVHPGNYYMYMYITCVFIYITVYTQYDVYNNVP